MKQRPPRFGARRPVYFHHIDEEVRAELEDVSEQGAFVHTSAMLPVNGVVDLHLSLPDGSQVTIPSQVAHCLPPDRASQMGRRSGIGFKFLDTPRDAMPALAGFLRTAQEEGRDGVYVRECSALVVARSKSVAGRLHRILSAGFGAVQLADSSERARYLFEARPWDLVVVDDCMDDWELIKHCATSEAAPPTPVLYVTSVPGEVARFHAQCMGAREVLTRPFFDAELMLRAAHLAASRRPDLAGDLSSVGTASVMSLLHFERRSGILSVHGQQWSVHVAIREGSIVEVRGPEGPTHLGLVLEALDWKHGRFEFRAADVQGDTAAATELSAVLMQHARMQDEGGEVRVDLP